MQRITESLLRKKCEHNENDIISVEEISLHQEDLGKIENLDKWCRNLKIILLQNNLISKMENLERLKYLEYLNLSINNVEKIENLEGCESLKKLDLTLNFIGELTSVDSLKKNIFLESLFLTGNPCTDYDGYRDYVVATLPQLKTLDGTDVMIAERIEALRDYEEIRDGILQEQSLYKIQRDKQRIKNKPKLDKYLDEKGEMIDYEVESGFWEESSDNSPETRIDIALKARKARQKDKAKDVQKKKPEIVLFKRDGTPYNTNLGRFPFSLEDNRLHNKIILDVKVPKYLDTSLIATDVQPNYVRVKIKSKILQIRLDSEVSPDKSKAIRSTSTGHLIVEMPRAGVFIRNEKPEFRSPPVAEPQKNKFLELDKKEKFDLMNFLTLKKKTDEKIVDNPDVPPLE